MLCLEIAQEIDHLRLHTHVERGCRLIQHDETGFKHHGAGNGDALALASGKLMRIPPAGGRIEADLFQRSGHTGIALVGRKRSLMHFQALGDDLAYGHARAERTVRVLKHHLQPVSERLHHFIGIVVDRLADEADTSLRRDQPRESQTERRLARAGFAHHAHRLACTQGDIDAINRFHMVDYSAHQPRLDREPDLDVVALHDHGFAGVGKRRLTLRFGSQKMAGIGVLRIGKHLLHRAGLDDLSLGHDADAVGKFADDTEIVGDEQHGHAVMRFQITEQLENLGLNRHVKRRRGFIGDEQFRPVGKRHGDHHTLPLAAGQFMRIGLQALFRFANAHLKQQFQRTRPRLRARNRLMQLQNLTDLPLDGVERVERGHRFLKDHGDVVAAHGAKRTFRQGQHILAVEQDFPRRMARCRIGQQFEDGIRRDRLTGTGFANEGDDFARHQVEGDLIDGDAGRAALMEGDGEITDREKRLNICFRHGDHRNVLRGSKASLTASPTKIRRESMMDMVKKAVRPSQGA
ncbi:hypothetical protein D3C72_1014910 [compost metagenome]